MKIYTVGHSTRSWDNFVALLRAHSVQKIVDVRSYPGSRRYPHFNKESMERALPAQGIAYVHARELGGRRKARTDSKNVAWRNAAFRGYADYMETAEFAAGLERLWAEAKEAPTAYMCSEAVWWRCHRSLISDLLKVLGHDVRHIMSETKEEEHPYTAVARLLDGGLSYVDGSLARAD